MARTDKETILDISNDELKKLLNDFIRLSKTTSKKRADPKDPNFIELNNLKQNPALQLTTENDAKITKKINKIEAKINKTKNESIQKEFDAMKTKFENVKETSLAPAVIKEFNSLEKNSYKLLAEEKSFNKAASKIPNIRRSSYFFMPFAFLTGVQLLSTQLSAFSLVYALPYLGVALAGGIVPVAIFNRINKNKFVARNKISNIKASREAKRELFNTRCEYFKNSEYFKDLDKNPNYAQILYNIVNNNDTKAIKLFSLSSKDNKNMIKSDIATLKTLHKEYLKSLTTPKNITTINDKNAYKILSLEEEIIKPTTPKEKESTLNPKLNAFNEEMKKYIKNESKLKTFTSKAKQLISKSKKSYEGKDADLFELIDKVNKDEKTNISIYYIKK